MLEGLDGGPFSRELEMAGVFCGFFVVFFFFFFVIKKKRRREHEYAWKEMGCT